MPMDGSRLFGPDAQTEVSSIVLLEANQCWLSSPQVVGGEQASSKRPAARASTLTVIKDGHFGKPIFKWDERHLWGFPCLRTSTCFAKP